MLVPRFLIKFISSTTLPFWIGVENTHLNQRIKTLKCFKINNNK